MHFYSARFAQAVRFDEHPKVISGAENAVCGDIQGVGPCHDGCLPTAIQEVDGQVVSGSVSGVPQMVGLVGFLIDSVGARVSFGLQGVQGPAGDQVFHQGEGCLRPVSAGYPDVDDHADKGYERGHPCCRCPGEAPNPFHNSIFPYKKNAAGATAAVTKESR